MSTDDQSPAPSDSPSEPPGPRDAIYRGVRQRRGGGQQASTPAPRPVPAPKGTTPTVAPPSTAIVPDVVGEQLSAAESALEARGFGNIPWLYKCHGSAGIET